MIRLLAPLMIVLSIGVGSRVSTAAPLPGAESIRRDLETLRVPSREGVDPATPVADSAAPMIIHRLRECGFDPLFEDSSYAQPVVFWIGVRPQGTNGMRDGRRNYGAMRDWVPLGFSLDGRLAGAPLVAAGRGLRIPSMGIDDYAGIDASGAVVLVVDGLPEGAGREALPFAERGAKAATARDAGAAGILFVADPAEEEPPFDSIPLSGLYADSHLLAARVRIAAAESLLAGTGFSIEAMARRTNGARGRVRGVDLEWIVSMRRLKAAPENIAGILRGRGRGCVLVTVPIHAGDISGRHENPRFHLGSAGRGAGVALVLDLASRLVTRREGLDRSVILAFTVGRDQEMAGAREFMMSLAVSGLSVDAVIAVDRPGAEKDDPVRAWAEPLDPFWRERLRGKAIDRTLDSAAPLDGRVYREAGLPVLQIHGPTADWFDTDADTPDRVDPERLARLSSLLEAIVFDLCRARGESR